MPITMRAYMRYDVRPSEEWTCNLEFDHEGGLDSGLVFDTALSFADGISEVLLNNVVIDRITVSTWVKDSAPYDPDNVRVIPIGIFGKRGFLLTDPVDDDLVIFIRKAVDLGRAGKILLRGTLTTAEIRANSGSWVITSTARTELETAIETWATAMIDSALACALVGAPLLSTTYPATAEGVKQIPIKNYATTPIIRAVRDFVLVGCTERQDTQ